MNVPIEIASLRSWLIEDEARLQSPSLGRRGKDKGRSCIGEDFNQHGNKWPNGPSETWQDFNNWGDSR